MYLPALAIPLLICTGGTQETCRYLCLTALMAHASASQHVDMLVNGNCKAGTCINTQTNLSTLSGCTCFYVICCMAAATCKEESLQALGYRTLALMPRLLVV